MSSSPTNAPRQQPAGDEQSLGYLFRYGYRAFARAISNELQPFDISSGQWSVLRVLWDREGLSQVELADRMRIEKASLTGVLDAMEKRGLISRTRNSDDRRKVNIHLTPRARSLKEKLLPFRAKINKKATRGMTSEEIETLQRLLIQVISNLED
ncbi:MAG: MarR family winged helix-turn-helix transcriptional regulator [Pseudorhodoplanes sp.]